MSKLTSFLLLMVILLFTGFCFTLFCYLETRDDLLLEKTKTASYQQLIERINNAEINTQKYANEIVEKKEKNQNNKDYLDVVIPDDIIDVLHKSHLSAVAQAKN